MAEKKRTKQVVRLDIDENDLSMNVELVEGFSGNSCDAVAKALLDGNLVESETKSNNSDKDKKSHISISS